MSDFFDALFEALGGFYKSFVSGFAVWWFPFVIFAAIYLIFIIFNFFTSKDNRQLPYLRTFLLFRNGIIALSLAAFVLIAFYCYLWAVTAYYAQEKTEFIHLFTVSSVLLTTVILLLFWRNKFDNDRFSEIMDRPLTDGEAQQFYNQASKRYSKNKIWLLLPALGFIMLIAIMFRSYSLVSFILDNSSSMDQHIEQGKDALTRTIDELDNNTDIVIGWLTENKQRKTSINEIVQQNNDLNLNGEHSFFTQKRQAIDYLYTIPRTGGTPLYETIWSNFLFTKTQSLNRTHDRRLLVLVTDGGDSNIKDDLHNFFCDQMEFSEFFTDVACINLGGDEGNAFFSKALDCDYLIEDGSDKESYSIALDIILNEYKSNWYFIIWLAISYVVFTLIALAIKPKRFVP